MSILGPGRGYSGSISGSHSNSGKSIGDRVRPTDWTVDASKVVLEYLIDFGSSGVRVYKAMLNGFQEVAVKEIPKRQNVDQEAEANGILQEVEVMVQTGSRCDRVLTLYGVYENDISYNLVMEFCEGGSLMNYIKRVREEGHTFDWYRRIKVACRIAEGMAFLHSCSVLHRDLKSPNVLLTESGDVKVADFGFSRQLSGQMSHLSLTGPTNPRWRAPEICNSTVGSTHWTAQADMYSFGVILWELTTLQFPFGKLDHYQVEYQLQRGLALEVPALADIPEAADFPALPRFLQLMERCLDKDPARRPQTFVAIISKLKSFQEVFLEHRSTSSASRLPALRSGREQGALASMPSPGHALGPAPSCGPRAPIMYLSTIASPCAAAADVPGVPPQQGNGGAAARRDAMVESVVSPFAQLNSAGSGELHGDELPAHGGSAYQPAVHVEKAAVAKATSINPTVANGTRSNSVGGGNPQAPLMATKTAIQAPASPCPSHLAPIGSYKESIHQFLEWFERLDLDANGTIEKIELHQGYPDDDSEGNHMSLLFKLIEEFEECDVNGDGQIDQYEFLLVAGRMLRAQLERAGKRFDLQTYEAESKQVLAELKDTKVYSMDAIDASVYSGITLEYLRWFGEWDADKDDRLRLEDVHQYIEREHDHGCEQYQMAKEIIVRFKDKGDGEVDKHEYLHLCARLLTEEHDMEMDEARCRFHLYFYATLLGDSASTSQEEESIEYSKVQEVASHALHVSREQLDRAASDMLGHMPTKDDRLNHTEFRRLLSRMKKLLEPPV